MAIALRTVLVGPPDHRFKRRLSLLFACGLFLATFGAYAVGFFEVTGGVVFLAGDAALVGALGAAVLGSRHSGVVFGWLAVYAALLGSSADHYLLGLSSRPVQTRIAAFLGPDGLAFLAVEAVVLGGLAWTAGFAAAAGVRTLREGDRK